MQKKRGPTLAPRTSQQLWRTTIAFCLFLQVADSLDLFHPWTICNRLNDTRFTTLPRSQVLSPQVETWVNWNFWLNRDAPAIQYNYPKPGSESVRWTGADAKRYEVFVNTTTQHTTHYAINWERANHSPYITDMLQCLGEPVAYAAVELYAAPPHQYDLWLWYPQQQMLVAGRRLGDTPQLQNSFAVREIVFTQMANSTAPTAEDSALLSSLIFGEAQALQPWPGLSNVQFTSLGK